MFIWGFAPALNMGTETGVKTADSQAKPLAGTEKPSDCGIISVNTLPCN